MYIYIYMYFYVYIYIYSHPQTDCFVLSELISVARQARFPNIYIYMSVCKTMNVYMCACIYMYIYKGYFEKKSNIDYFFIFFFFFA